MAHRITHALVEVLRKGTPKGRITQGLVEVLRGGDPKGRVTHAVVEVLRDSGFTTTTTTTTTITTTTVPLQISKVISYAALTTIGLGTSKVVVYAALQATTTTTTTTSTTVAGTVCWGHDTAVDEDYIRNLTTDWEGDGSVSGSGDSEKLSLYEGESEQLITPWKVDGELVIRINKYQSGDNVSIFYKTGSSIGATVAKSWTKYTGHFTSQGFVDVRLFRGSTTTTTTTATQTTVTGGAEAFMIMSSDLI